MSSQVTIAVATPKDPLIVQPLVDKELFGNEPVALESAITNPALESLEPAVADASGQAHAFVKDVREIVEHVVMVLVFVCVLRIFAAEAFVIPTGSMATTLMGAHKVALCPQCGHHSAINASEEGELGSAAIFKTTSGLCQNCREPLELPDARLVGGDRVLVAKYLYEGINDPQRWDVVVFKCPDVGKSRTNFIKRLIGLPHERIRLRDGDIHRCPSDAPPAILSKPARVARQVRRLVYDNDQFARDLVNDPPRWRVVGTSWSVQNGGVFVPDPKQACWLEYRHVLGGKGREGNRRPQLITDFEAYNTGRPGGRQRVNWVGDLFIELNASLRSMAGELTLEVGEGGRRYAAKFDFQRRRLTLTQNGRPLGQFPLSIADPAEVELCFANVDDRLMAWVDGVEVVGDGVPVDPLLPSERGPTPSDLTPARLGATQFDGVVSDLRLYRDIYYTQRASYPDFAPEYPCADPLEALPEWRQRLGELEGREFVMETDEYFMLGDNSPHSSDSREWLMSHVVPRNLIQGRALFVYFPFQHWGFVR